MSTPIQRHVKIKSEACPYNMAWEPYFEHRKILKAKDDLALYKRVKKLWQAQKGKCPICQEGFTLEPGWWQIHLVVPKLLGGKEPCQTFSFCILTVTGSCIQDRKCVTAPN
jgi:RNA-directed DNA polymerase